MYLYEELLPAYMHLSNKKQTQMPECESLLHCRRRLRRHRHRRLHALCVLSILMVLRV